MVNLSSQKFLGHAKQSATDALKSVSIKEIQKTVEATCYSIGNKISNEITKVLRFSPQNSSQTVETEKVEFDGETCMYIYLRIKGRELLIR